MQKKGFADLQLRKIEADDRFPCFACYDHPKDKLNCSECKGNGWLPGSHPMVQFAEDFIEQKLSTMTLEDFPHQMDNIVVEPRMSSSEGPKPKQKEVNFNSSTKTMPSNQLRQSRQKDNSVQVSQPFFCDECITKEPIKGLRYHCKECEDYDLCEACFLSGVHAETQHQFEEVVPPRRKDNETLVAENRMMNLGRKSVKM